MQHAHRREHIRLRGYARQEIVLGQLDELNGLYPRNRRKASEEIFQRGIAFNVIDQCLNRNASTLEAGSATEPFGIDPNDVIKQGSLFSRHTYQPTRKRC